MNITKKSLAFGLFSITFFFGNYISPMQNYIPDASYYILDRVNQDNILNMNICCRSESGTFYTFDGNKITTDKDGFCNLRLDQHAPKPQPTKAKVRYWPAVHKLGGGTYGQPGWFICFYDKNGNQIESYRYDNQTHEITTHSWVNGMLETKMFFFDASNPMTLYDPTLRPADFPLDLSNLQEIIIEAKP